MSSMNSVPDMTSAIAGPEPGTTRALRSQSRPVPPAETAPLQEKPRADPASGNGLATPERVQETVLQRLQERLAGHDVQMRYQEAAASYVIEIRDRRSGDLIYQMPPEEILQVHERLQEYLKDRGLLVDSMT